MTVPLCSSIVLTKMITSQMPANLITVPFFKFLSGIISGNQVCQHSDRFTKSRRRFVADDLPIWQAIAAVILPMHLILLMGQRLLLSFQHKQSIRRIHVSFWLMIYFECFYILEFSRWNTFSVKHQLMRSFSSFTRSLLL